MLPRSLESETNIAKSSYFLVRKRLNLSMTIKENEHAILKQIPSGEFEVWIKRFWTVGPNKGELIEPKDEDFGVSAWQSYFKGRAEDIFQEITDGRRGITPMVELF